jgi:hypothetical protein
VTIPHQSGNPPVFAGDGVVLVHQRERRRVVKVGALALHRLMRPLEVAHGLAAAVAALRATGNAPLRLGQLLFGSPKVAGTLHHRALGGDEEHLQPDSDARRAPGRRQRLGGHFGT